jgi:hypothetical protein
MKNSKKVEEFRKFCLSKGDTVEEANRQAEQYRLDLSRGIYGK